MDNLDDLIRYEKENSSLEFKVIQYTREKHDALIKDIMSMANADIDANKYIIVGVEYKPSNDRNIVGIDRDKFVDSAIYRQLVAENIEPEIIFDYFKYEIDGKYLGIFKIEQCNHKPYMMKKDFNNLHKGDCFIRKGDFQPKAVREDYERIYAKRISNQDFNGRVKIYFSGYAQNQEIALPFAKEIELPSEKAANEILKIIEEKKKLPRESPPYLVQIRDIYSPHIPYKNRSIEQLENNLKNIKDTYSEDDYYEFFESRSHKLNITIINEGDTYIEDATFQIDIEKAEGLFIPEKIYHEPKDSSYAYPQILHLDLGYPEVEDNGNYIRIISGNRGLKTWNIKHQMPEEAFMQPVRFLFLKDLAGQVVQLRCKLIGKNLKDPIEAILKIKIVPNDSLPKE
jgi:hypothetical protein